MKKKGNNHYLFGNLLLVVIVLFWVCAFYWASHAELDELVQGMGRVIPSSQIKTIQNLEGGILSAILVREGQKIEAGQVLMQLDQTMFHSGVREKLVEKDSLEASIARLRAEVAGTERIDFPAYLLEKKPHLVAQEQSLMRSRTAKLKADIDILIRNQEKSRLEIKEKQSKNKHLEIDLKIAKQKRDILKPLVEKQAASKIELLDLERQINRQRAEIEENSHQILKIKAAIKTAESRKESIKKNYASAVLGELSIQESQLEQLEQILPAIKDRLARTSIRSPVAGLVKQLFVNTIGGVIRPGESLVEIVPQKDSLMIEAQIKPKDIGFIRKGQKANIKFSAYDYSIYGGMDGELIHISADAIISADGMSYFLIRVKPENNALIYRDKKLPVMAGMECQVDIISGSRTVMDYILKPILKTKQSALHEP